MSSLSGTTHRVHGRVCNHKERSWIDLFVEFCETSNFRCSYIFCACSALCEMNWCFKTSVSTHQQQNICWDLIEQLVLCTSYSQLLFDQTLLQERRQAPRSFFERLTLSSRSRLAKSRLRSLMQDIWVPQTILHRFPPSLQQI